MRHEVHAPTPEQTKQFPMEQLRQLAPESRKPSLHYVQLLVAQVLQLGEVQA